MRQEGGRAVEQSGEMKAQSAVARNGGHRGWRHEGAVTKCHQKRRGKAREGAVWTCHRKPPTTRHKKTRHKTQHNTHPMNLRQKIKTKDKNKKQNTTNKNKKQNTRHAMTDSDGRYNAAGANEWRLSRVAA